MRSYFKRFTVMTGFAVLIVLLIGGTIATRRQLGIQISNQARVAEAREIFLELAQTESLLKDAETGQRGFLYTGDEKYLTPYNSAPTQIAAHLGRLDSLVSDNSEEAEDLAKLQALTKEKLDELATTVSLYQSGETSRARALVLSDAGLVTMDRIRDVVATMEQAETALVESRSAEYRRSARVTIATLYGAGAFGVLGLLFLAWVILQEQRLREVHSQEIRAREEWFRITLTSIGDAVIATDAHGKVTFMNPVAEQLTGNEISQSRGIDIQKVFPIFNEFTGDETMNPVQKVMEKGVIVGLANHTVLKHIDGHLVPIEDSAAPIRDDQNNLIGVVLVFRDVTIERNSQDLLRKSEKLAAAARLSATVAHEINNPLEAVGNLIYIAKMTPDAPPEILQQLTLAEHELDRVAHITRQTLGFYRESQEPGLIRIDALVESALKLYSNKLRTKDIQVDLFFNECPSVLGLQGELKQVISNLISNAIDAVRSGGRIVIRGEGTQNDHGPGAQLFINDNGPGIPPDIAHRIFEPFFTTKKDIGTGLGLWVTREIVERHGGTISVRPGDEEMPGASFAIYLPCDPNQVGAEPATLS